VITKACTHCRGQGLVEVSRRIEVKVPAGVDSGMRLRLAGEGEGGTRARGDLYVVMNVRPHPHFKRDGSDLYLEYPLNIAQAALGASVEVPTLNGKVHMTIPKGTQSGTTFRLRGKGLPDVHSRSHGDLMVKVHVETPTNLNARQRQWLEEMAKAFGTEVYPSHQSFLAHFKKWFKK
jgi:molecular chaperone DnaJ